MLKSAWNARPNGIAFRPVLERYGTIWNAGHKPKKFLTFQWNADRNDSSLVLSIPAFRSSLFLYMERWNDHERKVDATPRG
ncbi:MAG: hypothetical protein ACP5QR_15830, partial [Rhizomicrobium sp.]